jgi:hypothetical protein
MASTKRVQLELGFENGGLLRCAVAADDAAEIVAVFNDETSRRLIELDAEKGRVVVDLRSVAYVREVADRHSIGFGLRAT